MSYGYEEKTVERGMPEKLGVRIEPVLGPERGEKALSPVPGGDDVPLARNLDALRGHVNVITDRVVSLLDRVQV